MKDKIHEMVEKALAKKYGTTDKAKQEKLHKEECHKHLRKIIFRDGSN